MRRKWYIAVIVVGFIGLALPAQGCTGDHEDAGDEGVKAVESAAELSAPLRETFARFAPPDAKQGDIEAETENGLQTFSAEYDSKDGDVEITVLSDGTLVSIEQESKAGLLPGPIAAVAQKVLGAAPAEADQVQLAVYEFEDQLPGGVVRERYVDVFGQTVLEKRFKAGTEQESAVAEEDLPGQVRDAVEAAASGVKVNKLQREIVWGHQVYSVSWRAADGRRELKVLENGALCSLELPTGRLPARVVSIFSEGVGHAAHEEGLLREEAEEAQNVEAEEPENVGDSETTDEPTGVERMLLYGWEIGAKRDGHEVEAIILPTGEVLQTRQWAEKGGE